jgi:hypothetical protein
VNDGRPFDAVKMDAPASDRWSTGAPRSPGRAGLATAARPDANEVFTP